MQNNCQQCMEKDRRFLSLKRTDVSFVCATGIVSGLLLFCAGYFWGKRTALAVCTAEIKKMVAEQEKWHSMVGGQETFGAALLPVKQETKLIETDTNNNDQQQEYGRWYACLTGFAKEYSALKYKKLIELRSGIDVLVVQRVSSKNKKKKVWYQAVTHEYPTRKELELVIATLQKIKPLGNVETLQKNKTT